MEPTAKEQAKHPHLIGYNTNILGIKTAKVNPLHGKTNFLGHSKLFTMLNKIILDPEPIPAWKAALPTRSELRRTAFGRPSKDHSFVQEACFETCMIPILTSGFLSYYDFATLCDAHVLIPHMIKMYVKCDSYDFTWIAYENPLWKEQTTVPQAHAMAMMAALFHYKMHAADIMRFLGGTYTGEHRDIPGITDILISHDIDPWLIAQYVRATTVGCPNHFNAESSRENALLHWREGNHSSVTKHMVDVMNTIAKEHRNRYNMPLSVWIFRYLPHAFTTPQHMLIAFMKNARLIFDATKRYTALSTPLNMMTSTSEGSELDCLYGDVALLLYERIWDLRITYPNMDIILHANDVKSCFKQMKLQPDVMPAFSIVVANFMYLQSALPFGMDFSPQNWEPVRRVVEILAEKLFKDSTLRTKHRKYLDKLQWDKHLGSQKKGFVQAKACSKRTGVLDADGSPVSTPQNMFVDDSVYAEIYEHNRARVEQTVAAGIEAIFILLGSSDLSKRQDPVSFEKMEEMMVSYFNKVLGQIVNTRKLEVGVPPAFVAATRQLLKPFHSERKFFTVNEMEKLTGKITFIASTAPWVKFLLSQVYISIAAAVGDNEAYLARSNKEFRQLLKDAKAAAYTGNTRESTFALSETSKQVHSCDKTHWINKTLREELHLIIKALADKRLKMQTPLGHLVRRDPSAVAWSDSCLYAAGGWSTDMSFWWYIEWPPEVHKRTLIYIRCSKTGKLISINVLEYAAELVNYAASYHYYITNPDPTDPYPVVQLNVDNTAAESWAKKSCTTSLAGRGLSRLQCAMMINNPVGINPSWVSTKVNVISDEISRMKKETNSVRDFAKIIQAYPELRGCKRFQPSAELISHITDAILQTKCIDPMQVNQCILSNPGQIIS